MSDNIKKPKQEVKVQDRYIDSLTPIEQQYWQSQEPLDWKRIRNIGRWDKNNISNNTVYYTKKAWLVVATGWPSNNFWLTWYNDSNSSPTTVVANSNMNGPIWTNILLSITFPVLANSYYKVDSTWWLTLWYFIPIN